MPYNGQATTVLYTMAILQVCTRVVPTQKSCRNRIQFQRSEKVMVQALGQMMPTQVVQECHLWLNLMGMWDAEKVCLVLA